MGLLRLDGEVEGVVMEDDAVLVLGIRGRARYVKSIIYLSFKKCEEREVEQSGKRLSRFPRCMDLRVSYS